jgi:5-methyltetrahydrofolate--homocysteine methyltransferase
MAELDQIKEALIKGKAQEVKELVEKALQEGIEPKRILEEALIAGMGVIGERFRLNQIYVPEVMIAARAMNQGMAVLKPLLAAGGVASKGTIAIGTVRGDLHDIGKNLVTMMMEGAGYKIMDLGTNVGPQVFVDAAGRGADIIGMSALLTTTMTAMRDTVEALKTAGLREKVKVIVGGAPVTQEWADEIGADGYAPDAATAVEISNRLINK